MLMSVAEIRNNGGVYPELAGTRVLITGVGPTCGVDIARAFADHSCRLLVQIPEPCPETDALLAVLSATALEVRAHHDPIDAADAATRFTQTASKVYGGLETVVNLIHVSRYDLNTAATLDEIETLFVKRMQAAARTTGVAAGRMGLTWANGSILNVLRLPAPAKPVEAALAGIARTALATMVRSEAEKWADQGIRVNGIAPRSIIGEAFDPGEDCINCEPDIAAVALYLASASGSAMSGNVMDYDHRSRQLH